MVQEQAILPFPHLLALILITPAVITFQFQHSLLASSLFMGSGHNPGNSLGILCCDGCVILISSLSFTLSCSVFSVGFLPDVDRFCMARKSNHVETDLASFKGVIRVTVKCECDIGCVRARRLLFRGDSRVSCRL